MMNKYILAALLVLLMFNIAMGDELRLKENITCEQAVQLIQQHEKDSSFIILDVRTPAEFNEGHLKMAKNIDFKAEDFKNKLEMLDKSKTYLVYCRKGGRSASAIGLMNSLGFKTLFHLYEGYDLWKSKGNATTQ
jgi:phage shock protein E